MCYVICCLHSRCVHLPRERFAVRSESSVLSPLLGGVGLEVAQEAPAVPGAAEECVRFLLFSECFDSAVREARVEARGAAAG